MFIYLHKSLQWHLISKVVRDFPVASWFPLGRLLRRRGIECFEATVRGPVQPGLMENRRRLRKQTRKGR